MEDIEKKVWETYFSEALEGKGQEVAPSLWWQLAHDDLVQIAAHYLRGHSINALEAGCGSAMSSFRLSHLVNFENLYLLDIANNALEFAQQNVAQSQAKQHHFIEGSIFNLQAFKGEMDFCWNVGLIEHYTLEEIKNIVEQMYSTLKPGGILFIGIPNRSSLATLKASILGSAFGRKFLSFAKGYRNQTEILYSNATIKRLIEETTGQKADLRFAGSATFVETPDAIVRFFNKFLKETRFNFLTCFVVVKR